MNFAFAVFVLATAGFCHGRPLIVAYWGQNGVGHSVSKENYEKPLSFFCNSSKYDIINLSFMDLFFDSRNKDSMPDLNFAYHCQEGVGPEYPFLLRCPKIEEAIGLCQKNGKKVLMSLGGAAGLYGFANATQPNILSDRVWNLFLGGSKLLNLRPFGKAVLDGIDLDIEASSASGYADFVNLMRGYMKQDPSKEYLITGAPQCVYPDAHLGPDNSAGSPIHTALTDSGKEFDYLFIQYYNNYCYPHGQQEFLSNFQQWVSFAENTTQYHGSGPKLLIGVPAAPNAATGTASGAKYYQTPESLEDVFNKVKGFQSFGGFMLWDAGFDQNNMIEGKMYSEHVHDIINSKNKISKNKVEVVYDYIRF